MVRTAECVSPMHPDKICDRISDTILSEALFQDKDSRVAIETMGGHGNIVIMGEMTTKADIDIRSIAKGICGDPEIKILFNITNQSTDIARGVDPGGAGDQGIMIGYACRENEELIPQELYIARSLCKEIFDIYQVDGKTQVTLDNGYISDVVVSFQGVDQKVLADITVPFIKKFDVKNFCQCHFNPAGNWDIGGFDADTGLTGGKIVCDNYGPRIPIGGGAFSGKDPSKVDRSAAYMARRIAVDLLEQENAREVIVRLAYAIGLPEPVMATCVIDSLEMPIKALADYDLSPKGIIKHLDLLNAKYDKVAAWGSFGNGFSWG